MTFNDGMAEGYKWACRCYRVGTPERAGRIVATWLLAGVNRSDFARGYAIRVAQG